MDYATMFRQYLAEWKIARATVYTHGWNGWYLETGDGTKVMWPPKPQGSKKWAQEKLRQLQEEAA